jgi:hypothetical protein
MQNTLKRTTTTSLLVEGLGVGGGGSNVGVAGGLVGSGGELELVGGLQVGVAGGAVGAGVVLKVEQKSEHCCCTQDQKGFVRLDPLLHGSQAKKLSLCYFCHAEFFSLLFFFSRPLKPLARRAASPLPHSPPPPLSPLITPCASLTPLPAQQVSKPKKKKKNVSSFFALQFSLLLSSSTPLSSALSLHIACVSQHSVSLTDASCLSDVFAAEKGKNRSLLLVLAF